MTIPRFTVVVTGLNALLGVDEIPYENTVVEFTSNLTDGELLPIGNELYRVRTERGTINATGQLLDRDGNTGVRLLANDAALNLDEPLQWRVSFRNAKSQGFNDVLASWWFEAPADGETVDLRNLASVPGSVATGTTTLQIEGVPTEARNITSWHDIYYVDDYGADPTGATSSDEAVAAARADLGSSPGTLVFGVGTYLLTDPIDRFYPKQSVHGQGRDATVLKFTGTGTVITAYDSTAYSTTRNAVEDSIGGPGDGGTFSDFTIDGDGCGVGSKGMQLGDMTNIVVWNVKVRRFSNTSCIGIHFINQHTWTEKMHTRIYLVDNTQGVKFEKNGGTNSFAYSKFWMRFTSFANQDAFVTKGGVFLYHCDIQLVGNFVAGTGSNTGAVIRMGEAGSSDQSAIRQCQLGWYFEPGGNSGQIAHKTIQFDSTHTNSIISGWGYLRFWSYSSATPFVDGNSKGKLAVTGCIDVDSNVGTSGDGFWSLGARDMMFRGGSRGFLASTGGTMYLSTQGNFIAAQLSSGAQTITGFDSNTTAKANTGETGCWDIILRQPSSGTATVTWPAAITWIDGVAPTLSTVSNGWDHIRLVTYDFVTFFGKHMNNSADTLTLTNKTVDLASNTLTGTKAQFNTAMSDDDFVTLTGTETLTNKTLTTPKIAVIRDGSNQTIISTSNVASAVNYIGAQNAATGNGPAVYASGSDTNVDLNLNTKGSGVVKANSVTVATISGSQTLTNKTVDLASNTVSGTTAQFNTALSDGDFATLAGTETLTNKTLTNPKISTVKDTSNLTVFVTATTASAVNYIGVQNNSTGNAPQVYASGSDTNVNLNLFPKGSGIVTANGNPVGVKVSVPSTASSTGVAGQWAVDSSYVYFCTGTNTWVRAAVATW